MHHFPEDQRHGYRTAARRVHGQVYRLAADPEHAVGAREDRQHRVLADGQRPDGRFQFAPVAGVERLPLRRRVRVVKRGPLLRGEHEVSHRRQMTSGQILPFVHVTFDRVRVHVFGEQFFLVRFLVRHVG